MKIRHPRKKITGIIPAAGFANRLPMLPCSKEIFPIHVNTGDPENTDKVNIVSSSLLNNMRNADARNAFIIIRKDKWDIPYLLEDGKDFDLNFSYIVTPPTKGTTYTLMKALPFVQEDTILFGFPDILIDADNPFNKLLQKLDQGNSDIVLGLFGATNPQKVDMVDFNENGSIKKIHIKPENTTLRYTWLLAVWNSDFTAAIPRLLRLSESKIKAREIYIGDIVQAAIEQGMGVDYLIFQNSQYIDIGTPGDLSKVIRQSF